MIDAYSFGEILIDGKKYTADVIIFPDHVQADWWREEGHSLSLNDVQNILQYKPDILVVGCGASGIMTVPEKTKKAIEQQGTQVRTARTAEAIEIYNKLLAERKKAVAALHLTC